MAQTVYSVNAVGYVKIGPIPVNGFFLASNPLNLSVNSLAAVFPDAPANTKIYTLSGGNFSVFTKRTTGWTGTGADTVRLDPGVGFFIQNSTSGDLNLTFVGEVLQGTVTTTYPSGYSLLGSKIPQSGKVETDLKLAAQNGDEVYQLNASGAYVKSTKRTTSWTPSEPTVEVGNGFFLNAKAQGTWERTFSVNP
jgi:hypothetical protein